MTTQKKAVFAISRRERSNLGVNCEIAALRSRRQRKSCAFHRAPSSWSEAKDLEVIFTVEMLHCVQHDNSSKPSLMTVTTQSGKQESKKAVIPKIFSLGSEKPLDTSFRWYDDTTKFAVHLKLTT